MHATSVLFPLGGPRLTTILAISVFLAVAITREEKRPALACIAWLFGFEALFEATALALGRPELGPIHAAVYIVLGVLLLLRLTRRGVRPSLPILAAALAGLGTLGRYRIPRERAHRRRVLAMGGGAQ